MNHTVSGRDYFNLRFNGALVGETGIHAALCGTWGCPVLLVTGDDAACAEGRELLGDGLTTVAVKTGLGASSARQIPPVRARAMIEAGATKALSDSRRRRAVEPGQPVRDHGRVQAHARAGRAPLPARRRAHRRPHDLRARRHLVGGLEDVLLLERSTARSCPRGRSGPRAARRRRGAASRPRGSACPRSRRRGARFPAGSGRRRPVRSRSSRASPPTSPSSSVARPSCTSHASSFTSWYWRLRACPARTKRSLPTYASVSAQTSSQPHGFSTRRGVDAYRLFTRATRVGGDVLVGAAELLRRVDRQPQARVAIRAERSLRGELGERGRLVVALLREPLERLVGEDVDPAVDPVRDLRDLAEARHDVVVGQVDLAELRRRLRDRDRRGGARSRGGARGDRRSRRRRARRRSSRARRRSPAASMPRSGSRLRARAAPARPRRRPRPRGPPRRESNSCSWPPKQLTITRSTPAWRSRPICQARSGRPPTGTSDFGRPAAASPRRSALPPASTIASISRRPFGRAADRVVRVARPRASPPGRACCVRRSGRRCASSPARCAQSTSASSGHSVTSTTASASRDGLRDGLDLHDAVEAVRRARRDPTRRRRRPRQGAGRRARTPAPRACRRCSA